MLRRMSADHTSRPPPRAPRLGLAFGALVVALVVWVVWFVSRPAEDLPSQAPAASPPAASARPRIDAAARQRAAAAKEAESAPVPAAAPPAAPTEPAPAAAADVGQDIRGRAVRASDGSTVVGATVIALQRSGSQETELARATSGFDGGFTLHTPRSLDAFQVLVRDPSWAPDDPRPGQPVAVGVEWGSPGAETSELRLVLQTGWLLDVRVADSHGASREGVVVSGAGRSATTDSAGRCRLLDLPAAGGPITLTATAPGRPPVTQAVEPPTTSHLRQDVLIKLP